MDIIWIIWDALIKEAKNKSASYSKLIFALLNLYCIKYSPGCKKRRKYIIYFGISVLIENVDFNSTTPCTENFDTSTVMTNIDQNESTYNNQDNCVQDNEGNCREIAYYKMFVDFEIRGTFTNYIKFRNIIASEEKIVNIENEEILRDTDVKTNIIATATVSLIKTPQ